LNCVIYLTWISKSGDCRESPVFKHQTRR
jgi:hypothetical protein